MSLCRCRRSQLLAISSLASQSRSSGCVGGSPWRPKSLGVRTRPAPKCHCQIRLTRTRATSGLSFDVSQFARIARRWGELSLANGLVVGGFATDASFTRDAGSEAVSYTHLTL